MANLTPMAAVTVVVPRGHMGTLTPPAGDTVAVPQGRMGILMSPAGDMVTVPRGAMANLPPSAKGKVIDSILRHLTSRDRFLVLYFFGQVLLCLGLGMILSITSLCSHVFRFSLL